MKFNFFLFILFLSTVHTFGQISFEKGYFIDSDNRKTDCLIKNDDWKNNPTEFIYKVAGSDLPEKATIDTIKEFGIYNFSSYKRSKVKIDRSGEDNNNLTDNPSPVWSEEEVFLKVLFNGKASLFYYKDDHSEKFFYSIADTNITQLIYRKYLDEQKHIVISNRFRQQLWLDIKCTNATLSSVEKINYNHKDLEKYFITYSKCMGDNSVEPNAKLERDWINLKIAPGINIATITMDNSVNYDKTWSFINNTSFRIGVEAEFVLPFKKNKWAVLVEPTFQSFKDTDESGTETSTVNFNSIEFPVGLRYNIFLNEELKMYLNGIFISKQSLNFNSKIDLAVDPDHSITLDITAGPSFAFGGGVEYKRASAEIRYYTNREILNDYQTWFSKYTRVSLILGYKIFKKMHNV